MVIEKTLISGPLFTLGAFIVATILVTLLWSMWNGYATKRDKFMSGFMENGSPPEIAWPLVISAATAVVYLLATALTWSHLQTKTTSMSTYRSPAEIAEQKKVAETKTPTEDEMVAKRAEQKKRADDEHQKALKSYDEAMEQEAGKIRERSDAVSLEKKPDGQNQD